MWPVEKMIHAVVAALSLLQSNTEQKRWEIGLNSCKGNTASIHSNHAGHNSGLHQNTASAVSIKGIEIFKHCLQKDPVKGLFVLQLIDCQIGQKL